MPSRLFATAFLAGVFLAEVSGCSRRAQEAGTPPSTSPAVLSKEARPGTRSDVKKDEEVLFYPTYACQTASKASWTLAIHGSIFEPELSSMKRAAALELLRTSLGLPRGATESEIFRRRARAFLVDNERGKNIAIRLGDRVYAAGVSEPNGHFAATLEFSAADADRLRPGAGEGKGWLAFQAVARRGDNRTFAGRVQWIAPKGHSVISDIDDTIKISNVQDREALLANTFLREFQPVLGMSTVYRRWADAGAAFHYVSASPWQLYQPLADFCGSERFPAGTFHMKLLRLSDSSALSFFASPETYKTEVIEKIFADFPRRRFTLVGDSGEQDPEVYAAAARTHPDQIEHIFIRNVGGRGSEPSRFRKAFEGIPADRWKVFDKPEELPESL